MAKSDNVTYLATSYCDGTQLSVITNTSCTVSSSIFNGSPYFIQWGNSIYAIVAATNIYGTSSFSPIGNGAVIITVPGAPTISTSSGTYTITTSSVRFICAASNKVVGASVIDYSVYWDQGSANWALA